ncbi:MAG: NAD-dependent epimerase/dehydratase family protein [Methylobacter sp.]|nr:NAD-dependent epimerase/dehydratase family protein [Methylobacter sp.]
MVKVAAENKVGVFGATGFVGTCLLPLLVDAGWRTIAYSRKPPELINDNVEWRLVPSAAEAFIAPRADERNVSAWICVAPVWVLPEYFSLLEAYGARRVVVLSSTSRYTKDNSPDPEEQAMARRLAEAESCVQEWAKSRGVEWVILRPTLIYGLGRDKNITEIIRFIRRFGFFPLFGKAAGLRRPVHVQDVADACLAALQTAGVANHAYNLSGRETLSYRDMVVRIFAALDRQPRLLSVPLTAFRIAVALLRCLPRYRHWSAAMAERMNRDLVFDHAEAARDLAFEPRGFVLSAEDLPR